MSTPASMRARESESAPQDVATTGETGKIYEFHYGDQREDQSTDELHGEIDELRNDIESLKARIDELESGHAPDSSHASKGLSLGYGLGMAIAVVLSWSRNASILLCVVHGFFSWIYVIYFAATR